jgi:predicted nuclease with RNAse H fold
MITLGIDLSSQRKDTAACLIEWTTAGAAQISEPTTCCDDSKLHELIRQAKVVGIDAPLGWPSVFSAAVLNWTAEHWTDDEPLRKSLRFRSTDLEVNRITHLWPLSVSTDRIALPAMRAMALLKHFRVTDKSGAGRFYEVYPVGSLKCWGLRHNGYKRGSDEAEGRRLEMLASLRQKLPTLTIPDAYAETDHALDALVASLTARSAALGRTRLPAETQRKNARVEGWIHLPNDESIAACTQIETKGARG